MAKAPICQDRMCLFQFSAQLRDLWCLPSTTVSPTQLLHMLALAQVNITTLCTIEGYPSYLQVPPQPVYPDILTSNASAMLGHDKIDSFVISNGPDRAGPRVSFCSFCS